MNEVYQSRRSLGAVIRQLRHDRGWSLREMERSTGIVYSFLSAVELGERAVGSVLAARLAEAFELEGSERDQFFLGAAGTRKKDRLVACARNLAPEILNYLPLRLQGSGVVLPNIISAQIDGEELRLVLQDGTQICCQLSIEQEGKNPAKEGNL